MAIFDLLLFKSLKCQLNFTGGRGCWRGPKLFELLVLFRYIRQSDFERRLSDDLRDNRRGTDWLRLWFGRLGSMHGDTGELSYRYCRFCQCALYFLGNDIAHGSARSGAKQLSNQPPTPPPYCKGR